MNIIEAIKIGKKFRRRSWAPGVFLENRKNLILNRDAILEDDWEIEKKSKFHTIKYPTYFSHPYW